MPEQSNSNPSPSDQSETKLERSLLEVSLSGAIALARDGKNAAQANEQFEAILSEVSAEGPKGAMLLKQLWQEYTSVQRSAAFWESMSDAEKELSDKMAQSNIQLQRNHMRLIQEQ